MDTVSTQQARGSGASAGNTARDLFQQALEAAKAGDRLVARTLFEQVTRAHPGIPQAWLWRAHLAEAPEEQVGYLSRARELEPENPKTRAGLIRALVEAGIACAKKSAKGEARRYLNEATRLEPAHEAAWLWLASLADTSSERLRCVDKVLVIDDSMTVRSLVNRTLSRRGCQVTMAVNAEEALARLREKTPDLIFLDIDLPDIDGFELCRRIKAREATGNVPVLMLSGKDGAADKMLGQMVGAEAHISKPFRPEDLVEAVQQFCS